MKNEPKPEAYELTELIKEEYRKLDDQDVECISISVLADVVYARIDPRKISPMLVKMAAVLELRQIARGTCRERQARAETESESGSLFDFQLQPRYPAERQGEDVYVLREHLTYNERHRNIARLRREAAAKSAHADALEAETEQLIRQGKLATQESVNKE